MNIEHVRAKHGIAKQIIKMIEEELEHNPDLKAKAMHVILDKKRRSMQTLKQSNSLSLLKNAKFVPTKIPESRFLFSKDMLPTLKQVIYFS